MFNRRCSIEGTYQNFDLLKIHSHGNTADLLTQAFDYGLVPTITKPTRVTHSSATPINNIYLTSTVSETVKSGIIMTDISDHLPILPVIESSDYPSERKNPLLFKCRTVNNDSIQAIQVLTLMLLPRPSRTSCCTY